MLMRDKNLFIYAVLNHSKISWFFMKNIFWQYGSQMHNVYDLKKL